MKPVRIFRHVDCEGPGFLATFLDDNQIPYEIIAIDQQETVPDRIDDVSGLVFMGGPMSVNDDLPWISDELALIQKAAAAELPLLGHCLGGQLISKALGGVVGPNPHKEIGWFPVDRVTANTWTTDIPLSFTPYHWHGETFSLPEGAELLLSNANCAHQAFSLGNTLAFQCHVEMTADMVREWATLYAEEIAEDQPRHPHTIQDYHQQTIELERRVHDAQAVAGDFYTRWISRLHR